MITVYTKDGETPFPDATRFATDEHNNLEIMAGRDGEASVHCFSNGYWLRVGVDDGK